MATNLQRYKEDLQKLIQKGHRLELGFIEALGLLENIKNKDQVLEKTKPLNFNRYYESWYTEALSLISQLIPARLEDFIKLYKNENRKDIDFLTYTISDHLIGLVTRRGGEIKADGNAALPKFQQQLKIVYAIENRFESSLHDIKQLVQADLFDSELESAKNLNSKGFYRAAGVICGVLIEKHLGQVCENHQIDMKKKYIYLGILSV